MDDATLERLTALLRELYPKTFEAATDAVVGIALCRGYMEGFEAGFRSTQPATV